MLWWLQLWGWSGVWWRGVGKALQSEGKTAVQWLAQKWSCHNPFLLFPNILEGGYPKEGGGESRYLLFPTDYPSCNWSALSKMQFWSRCSSTVFKIIHGSPLPWNKTCCIVYLAPEPHRFLRISGYTFRPTTKLYSAASILCAGTVTTCDGPISIFTYLSFRRHLAYLPSFSRKP